MSIQLKQEQINLMQAKEMKKKQFTKEMDVNLSELKPDIDKILKVKTRPVILNKEIVDDKVVVRGAIECNVLYIPLNDQNPIHNIETTIPIQEEIYIENLHKEDNVKVICSLEDIDATEINTRKVNIKTIGNIGLKVTQQVEKMVTTDIDSDDPFEKRMGIARCCQMKERKNIKYKMKEEAVIPSGSPNILEVLWHEVVLLNSENKVLNRKNDFLGNIKLSMLYISEEATEGVHYFETSMPYKGQIDLLHGDEESIVDMDIQIGSHHIGIQADEDGEDRKVLLDIEADIDLKVFKEEDIQYLEDIYGRKHDVNVEKENILYQKFICKNQSQYNLKKAIDIEESNVLQIHHINGEVYIDSVDIEEDSIQVEGALMCNVMYVPSDDQLPIDVIARPIPIEYTIEIGQVNDLSIVNIRPKINDITCMVLNEQELEIKCQLVLETLVFEEKTLNTIKNIELLEVDLKELKGQSGITGYIVKENDSLWDIGKKFRTTMNQIISMNNLESPQLLKGEKLIIVKDLEV